MSGFGLESCSTADERPAAQCASSVRRISSLARNCSASRGGVIAFSWRQSFSTVFRDSRMLITSLRCADLTAVFFMRVQTRSIEFMAPLFVVEVCVVRETERRPIGLRPICYAAF
jgi:hypothetical protein